MHVDETRHQVHAVKIDLLKARRRAAVADADDAVAVDADDFARLRRHVFRPVEEYGVGDGVFFRIFEHV